MDLTIDEIGEYLEHQGATDAEIDVFLAHFGVAGMRWGVRRGREASGTGLSRSRQLTIEYNKNAIKAIKQAKSGEKYKLSSALGRAVIGREQQTENWNHSIKTMNNQVRQIEAGKKSITVAAVAMMNPLGLLISTTRV